MTPGALVVVRGAGDLASGVLHRLFVCGYKVAALEVASPKAVRRTVSFSEAVYDGKAEVEGATASLFEHDQFRDVLSGGLRPDLIPVTIDPDGSTLSFLSPDAIVDARMLKQRDAMGIDDAPLVVGLGPGHVAGEDVDVVIETWRGQDLGRCIWNGSALSDTATPASVEGRSAERVMLSPAAGRFLAQRKIGDLVSKGDVVGRVGDFEIRTAISGLLRGLIRSGLEVREGEKLGDTDPRGEAIDHTAISDKARAVAGGVLEALLAKGYLPSKL